LQADRLPPHDIESEEAVIGSLLVDSEAFTRVIAFLNPNDFYRERNRWCYEACFELFQRPEALEGPVSPATRDPGSRPPLPPSPPPEAEYDHEGNPDRAQRSRPDQPANPVNADR